MQFPNKDSCFVIKPKSVTLAFNRYVSEAGFGELTVLDFWFDESWPLCYYVYWVAFVRFLNKDSRFEIEPKSVTLAFDRLVSEAGFEELTVLDIWFDESWP
jgi:hypothetical protein